MTSVDWSLASVLLAALIAFLVSGTQSFFGSKAGSDHPVHIFITNAIRGNGHRLFERIPGLLNTCYCGAIPLYTHWILSFFQKRVVFWAERLLNPFVNSIHVLVFAGIAGAVANREGLPASYIALGTFAFALTPQFSHALSARNFGLSARGVGLVLLTLFFSVAYFAEQNSNQLVWWISLGLLGSMVWAFSTFAQQALSLVSLILLVTTGRYAPLVGTFLGLALFVAFHPRYSLSYLRYTYRFLRAYAKELAPIYVLRKRKSIWGDLVGEIWLRFGEGFQKGALYAYENSVLVVLFLNPFVVIVCWLKLANQPMMGLVDYAGSLALAGTIAALITSFRPTRFLGEPERYVEAIAPWAVICGTYFVYLHWSASSLLIVVLLSGAVNVIQVYGMYHLMKHASVAGSELDKIEATISRELGDRVRFCSNNEQLTKLLLANPWRFALYLVVGQQYCGMNVSEAFSKFPFLKRDACERIVSSYRVNACLLDRKLYDVLFDERPASLGKITVAYESNRFRLLVLEWVDAPVSAHMEE